MRIEFQELGREKWSGSIPIKDGSSPDEVAEAAYRASLKHILSRFPDVDYDAEKNEGVVSAGYRVIGRFRVLQS